MKKQIFVTLGRTIVANPVRQVVVAAETGIVIIAGRGAAIRENVPPETMDLNLKRFRRRLELGGKAPIEESAHATV